MSKDIHETAVISAAADIDPSVTVGPFAVIEDNVHIGAGTSVGPHAVIRRFTRIGRDNFIDAQVLIGGLPQHAGFDGSDTWVIIGDNNVIREGVTIHRGFEPGGATRIGSNCFFMTATHVGHDCQVADHVTLTSAVLLGGHVEVGRNVVMGANSGAHQFTRVGAYSMVAGLVALRKDALPFTIIGGEPVRHYRLNTVGLRRNGIKGERYRLLERAFRALRDGNKSLDDLPDSEEVALLRDWLATKSKYGHYGFAAPTRR